MFGTAIFFTSPLKVRYFFCFFCSYFRWVHAYAIVKSFFMPRLTRLQVVFSPRVFPIVRWSSRWTCSGRASWIFHIITFAEFLERNYIYTLPRAFCGFATWVVIFLLRSFFFFNFFTPPILFEIKCYVWVFVFKRVYDWFILKNFKLVFQKIFLNRIFLVNICRYIKRACLYFGSNLLLQKIII